jgi:hypothetical protein
MEFRIQDAWSVLAHANRADSCGAVYIEVNTAIC